MLARHPLLCSGCFCFCESSPKGPNKFKNCSLRPGTSFRVSEASLLRSKSACATFSQRSDNLKLRTEIRRLVFALLTKTRPTSNFRKAKVRRSLFRRPTFGLAWTLRVQARARRAQKAKALVSQGSHFWDHRNFVPTI